MRGSFPAGLTTWSANTSVSRLPDSRNKNKVLTHMVAILTQLLAPKRCETMIFEEKSVSSSAQYFEVSLCVNLDFGQRYVSRNS